MKRISVTDFNAGIIDAVDPTLIPDNALTEAENYEYLDLTGLKKRKDVEFSELNDAGFSDIHSFVIWYPSKMPTGATSDKILIAHADGAISAKWEAGSVWNGSVLFSNIPDDANVVFYAGYDRVLIADGVNPGRSVYVNKDNELEYGDLGISAPLTMLTVSVAEGDVLYSETADVDVGMAVERGNLIQYCYTVEDRYGNESNPSPIITERRLVEKYPDATSPLGAKYYYRSLLVSGFSLDKYPQQIKDRLSKFNLYRRDAEFTQGTMYKQFSLVKQIDVGTSTAIDSTAESLGDISYDNLLAPPSNSITEHSGVIYIGGVKNTGISFHGAWDRYVEITLANNNGIDYMDTVVAFVLNYATLDIDDWVAYLNNLSHIRLFFSDMITPCQVVCQASGQLLYLYARVPYIYREGDTKLYLAVADSSAGVGTNWDSYDYGKFFNFADTSLTWSDQRVFLPPLVENSAVSASIYPTYPERRLKGLYNLADALSPAAVTSYTDEIVSNTSSDAVHTRIFSDENMEIVTPLTINRTATTIEMTLAKGIGEGSLITIYARTPSMGETFFETGNLSIELTTDHYIRVNVGSSMLDALMPMSENEPFRMCIYIYKKNYGVYVQRVATGTIWETRLEIGAEYTPDIDTITISNLHVLGMLKVMDIGSLSWEDVRKITRCYTLGIPYVSIPIGSDLSLDYLDWSVSDVKSETKEIENEENANLVQWSNIGSETFPALNFKRFKEDVLAITDAPSFLKQQYQNTIIVFTRNTVSRIVLSDDLSKMAQIENNVIEEFKSAGLYSPESLVSSGNAFYWLSEIGVIRWSPDGLVNLSRGKKDIPLGMNYIGAWVANSAQYLLHDRDTGITYVYHELNDAWTVFTGMNISKVSYLNLGADTENRILMYDGENLVEYPAVNQAVGIAHTITTKQFALDNLKPFRYRYMSERGSIADKITASTFNHFLDDEPITAETISPMRYEWVYLPNGFWGEYLQLSFDNITALTKIDLDIREGV